MKSTRYLGCGCGTLFLFVLLAPAWQPLAIFCFGWISFPPEIFLQIAGVLWQSAASVIIFIAIVDWLMVGIYRLRSQDQKKWQLEWTIGLLLIVAAIFAITAASIALVRHTRWLSEEKLKYTLSPSLDHFWLYRHVGRPLQNIDSDTTVADLQSSLKYETFDGSRWIAIGDAEGYAMGIIHAPAPQYFHDRDEKTVFALVIAPDVYTALRKGEEVQIDYDKNVVGYHYRNGDIAAIFHQWQQTHELPPGEEWRSPSK